MGVTVFDPRPVLAQLLREHAQGRRVRVLEAGCGTAEHLGLPGDWAVTGLDISPEALALNTRIDERIVGDLQRIELPARFDVVVCWDVLEHLPDPASALRNMAGALNAGGLLVIGLPLRSGFKAWATRLLPFPVHVLYYRHVLRWEHAGEPGHRPFPTFLRPEIQPGRMRELLGGLGLQEVWGCEYATVHYGDILHGHGALSWFTRVAARTVDRLSLGAIHHERSDFTGVYRRTAAP